MFSTVYMIKMKKINHKNIQPVAYVILAFVVFASGMVGTTLAWLTAKSGVSKNTFTPSNIAVDIEEMQDSFEMVPGIPISKAPRVIVKANSEDCWLFLQANETDNLGKYIIYTINESASFTKDGVTHGGWTQGDGTYVPVNVFYRRVTKDAADQSFGVLGAGVYTFDGLRYSWSYDEVLTKPEVTLTDMRTALTTKPELSFVAYAVQLKVDQDTEFTAAEAWERRVTS